jgi:hypothetical protein
MERFLSERPWASFGVDPNLADALGAFEEDAVTEDDLFDPAREYLYALYREEAAGEGQGESAAEILEGGASLDAPPGEAPDSSGAPLQATETKGERT